MTHILVRVSNIGSNPLLVRVSFLFSEEQGFKLSDRTPFELGFRFLSEEESSFLLLGVSNYRIKSPSS
ncbi:hypothetical protein L2E82_15765 [Cichorium intybus]|uniref:Uncharacterized protein n=1 Tax=Cichorium intybus TaxID=13427 RepID=A0ACB9F4L3_CICIN|nr:hypothetical protein L2E82_15765 [Cichorium intybus]